MIKSNLKLILVVAGLHFFSCSLAIFFNHIYWFHGLLGASHSISSPIFYQMLIILTFPVRNLIRFGSVMVYGFSEQNHGLLVILVSSLFYGLLFGCLRIPDRIYAFWCSRWIDRSIYKTIFNYRN